jgi:hypothetical protein
LLFIVLLLCGYFSHLSCLASLSFHYTPTPYTIKLCFSLLTPEAKTRLVPMLRARLPKLVNTAKACFGGEAAEEELVWARQSGG